jgi:hypothetical protein
MLTPTASNPSVARGVLAEVSAERIVLEVPGTSYRVQLEVYQPPRTAVGKRIIGTIRANAKRVDVVVTGGRYLEPVYGRPRRLQGEVVGIDAGENSITVDATIPIVCKLTDPRQKAGDFKVGDFVALDVTPGATFTPSAGA